MASDCRAWLLSLSCRYERLAGDRDAAPCGPVAAHAAAVVAAAVDCLGILQATRGGDTPAAAPTPATTQEQATAEIEARGGTWVRVRVAALGVG